METLDYIIVISALVSWGLIFFLAYKTLRFVFRLATGKVAVRESLAKIRDAYRREMERQQVVLEQKRIEKLQKPKRVTRKRDYSWLLIVPILCLAFSNRNSASCNNPCFPN